VAEAQKRCFRSAELRVFHGRATSTAKAEVGTITTLPRRMTDAEYQYRRYMASGSKYAGRRCVRRDTGCVGPLTRANTQRHAVEEYFFDDWPKAAAWAEASCESLRLFHIDAYERWE
jgi:hypothetical protein